jgi:hypothetical protein
MPRALRLAKQHNLAPEPVAADFQSAPEEGDGRIGCGAMVMLAIPSAETLSAAGRLSKEGLAYLVGR